MPIDNIEAERALRRIAVGRKNWLFVGSEDGGERAAIIQTVIASAHRHDLDVWAYLRDVFFSCDHSLPEVLSCERQLR